MKIKLFIASIVLGLLVSVFYSCSKDEQPQPQSDESGKVTFGYNSVQDISKSSSKSSKALEDASAIIISITGSDGNAVYTQEQLPLINVEGSFITEPISLLVGDYMLTEFIVVDEAGVALYIAPLEGSTKAYLVDNPLPIDFAISEDEVLSIVPEVLDTESSTPEDFGYTTFSFEVVETFDFLIGAFIYDASIANHTLTTAQVTVEAESIAIYSNDIEAITDTITINDGYSDYILTVTKEGYNAYVDTFTNAELKQYFSSDDNGPLVVVLDEYIAMGLPCPDAPTVTDADGNVYATVQIGDQCWMAENLNTGINILPSENETDNGIVEKLCYNDNTANCDTYGGLYTWDELMSYTTTEGTRGICPSGWHIPTIAQWQILEGTVDSEYGVNDPIWDPLGWRGSDVTTQLKPNGISNFNVLFAGNAGTTHSTYVPGYTGLGQNTYFWTSSEYNAINGYQIRLYSSNSYPQSFKAGNGKGDRGSVRCLKD